MAARQIGKYWYVSFYFHYADGRCERIRRKSPVNTKRDAEAYERQLRADMLANPDRREKKEVPLFSEFAKEFQETYVKINNSLSEQAGKKSILTRHLIPLFGKRRLDQFTARDIEDIKGRLIAQKLKPSTVNNILVVFRKLLNYAKEIELIEKVPKFRMLRVPPQPFNFLNFDEYATLISAVIKEDMQLALTVALGAEAGLRRGEINGLKWEDINFDTGKLAVMRSLWQGKENPPKGGRPRVIPLTLRLKEMLRVQRSLCKHVIVRPNGLPLNEAMFDDLANRAYRLAKIPRPAKPWHTLRHTFCSHLAMRGAHVKEIQELAGHADLKTTLRYMHLAPSSLDAAIAKLNGASNDEKLFGQYLGNGFR